jgi:NADPH2:quinone reductase
MWRSHSGPAPITSLIPQALSGDKIVERVRHHTPHGIDHIVEVAFHPNITIDEQLLGLGGSIATYATGSPTPTIPFWPLVFKNIRLYFLGSDDFPAAAKLAAAQALNEALAGEWPGPEIEVRFRLESITEAHEAIEQRKVPCRVILTI